MIVNQDSDNLIHVNISMHLPTAHEIYASFDCNSTCHVRGIFLDISKAFDRVWHEGLIYKVYWCYRSTIGTYSTFSESQI